MKKKLKYRDFAKKVYGEDTQSRKLFIHQMEEGWTCWHNPKNETVNHEGQEYRYVATDDNGRGYYQNDYGSHVIVLDKKVIEILKDDK